MANQQYDVSEKMQKLFAIKQKQRQETKEYYAKAMGNPHRTINDPPPFDPVFFRYSSLHSYAHEHYRPNPKNMFAAFTMIFFPILSLAWFANNYHKKREKILRGGEVAYKDRVYKIII